MTVNPSKTEKEPVKGEKKDTIYGQPTPWSEGHKKGDFCICIKHGYVYDSDASDKCPICSGELKDGKEKKL